MCPSISRGQHRKHSWVEMLPAEHMKVSFPKPLVVPESSKRRFTGTALPYPHSLPEMHALEVCLYRESKQTVHIPV